RIARERSADAIIALGAIVRGETPHFEQIAAEVAKGLAGVATQSGLPVTLGVLTTLSLEQAIDRAGGKAGNKGWEAAVSAIEMLSLFASMSQAAERPAA